jgi:murein DD-endopeptidase MepM/ murein hydrolase activator NlpD
MDIPAGKGTPVVAAESGTVITAGASGGGLGNRIIIQHNDQNKTQSLYAHLNSIEVRVSTQVQRGQRIGTVGATGNVTGPHLHFEFSNRRPYHDIYRSRYNNIRLSEAAARFPQ